MKQVSVIGAGTMGAGIAQVFARAGWSVVLLDNTQELAEKGKSGIQKSLRKAVEKGRLPEYEADCAIGNVAAMSQLNACADSDLVIEAVYESLQAKQVLFKELEGVVRRDAVLASNTSSISITQIASVLAHKSRFAGMHFFNPAPVMKLVEVIEGMQTDCGVTEAIMEIARGVEKTPVKVAESAGFVVNRLLVPMVNEAVGIYAEGAASAEDIDTAMTLGANHPMGPLALGDLIGLDVCLAIMEVLHGELGEDKYRAHPLLKKMVRAGRLGQKNGEGFFQYKK